MTDPTPEFVKVVSPATLEGGATFEAEVDGKTFMVTVPDGGVGEGDNFDVPYPVDDAIPVAVAAIAVPAGSTDADAAVNKNEVGAFQVPTGSWRNDCCSCFETCCCPFMMGWCCFPILMGQIMQRMKMNFFGCEKSANENQAPICIAYTAATIGLFLLGLIIQLARINYIGPIIWFLWAVYMTTVFTCARMTMRKKYKIEPGCCGDNCCDDCLFVYFCSCCTAIQMERHTHDENQYGYNLTSQIGLDDDAPEIV